MNKIYMYIVYTYNHLTQWPANSYPSINVQYYFNYQSDVILIKNGTNFSFLFLELFCFSGQFLYCGPFQLDFSFLYLMICGSCSYFKMKD